MRKKVKSEVVSVIIPVHNRHNLLLKCLDSVKKQRNLSADIEIIIVDDASKPGIKTFLKKQKKLTKDNIRVITNKNIQGPAKSRNSGLKVAKGDYIYFLDSDDICRPDFLRIVLSKLNKSNSEVITTLVNPIFIDDLGFIKELNYEILSLARLVCFWAMTLFNNYKLDKTYFYMMRLSGTIFTNKSISKLSFDDSYKSAEDWKFILDVIKINKPNIKVVPRFLVDFSYHKDSETIGRSGYWNYYEKLIEEIPGRMKNQTGMKLFIFYTKFSAIKEKWLKI